MSINYEDYEQRMQTAISTAPDGAVLEKLLMRLIEDRDLGGEVASRLLVALRKRADHRFPEDRDRIRQRIAENVNAYQVEHEVVRSYSRLDHLHSVPSFRASMAMRSRKHRLAGWKSSREWLLDDKTHAYRFADLLDIPRPQRLQTALVLDDVEVSPGTVIKPVKEAHSRGIYIVQDDGRILDVRKFEYLRDEGQLHSRMHQDMKAGRVRRDAWNVDEFVGGLPGEEGPARDVKFYCFYGRVALISEAARLPELKGCWISRDNKVVDVGQPFGKDPNFVGMGASEEEFRMAERISSEIPAPYIRLDFLRGAKGLMLGEFTMRPGAFHKFGKAADRWMGDLFLGAEARLMEDALNGKSFEAFNEFRRWLRRQETRAAA